MAPKKAAVNLANLEALGAKRLAEILLELGSGDAGIKRRLRLELSAEAGAEAVAADIGKRITTLRQARSFVDWQKRPAFVKDLDLQRQLIVDKVARDRPDLALELLWRFMGLAEPVLNRVDDSRGDVGDVFRQACHDLGAVALAASPDPVRLADRVFEAVTTNDYGEYDRLVELVFPALEGAGVARLKERLTAALAERPKTKDRLRHPSQCAPPRLAGHRRWRRRYRHVHRARDRPTLAAKGRRDREPSARRRPRRRSARLPQEGRARRALRPRPRG